MTSRSCPTAHLVPLYAERIVVETIEQLINDIQQETEKIWIDEPDEIKAMRLGVFPAGAGTNGQFFSNLVFVNGDMRALSTWITPAVILRSLDDEAFDLDQCKKLFEWTNLINVDFLAYCGFVEFGNLVHRIVEAYPDIGTKKQFTEVLRAWYAYANRLYMWVHQVFPWGLGVGFQKVGADDIDFMKSALGDESVARYFELYGPKGSTVP